MQKLSVNVLRVVVLTGEGTDKVCITIDAPTGFRVMKYATDISVDTEHGYGAQWVQEALGLMPDEVIDTRGGRRPK
jgi:hypothetical protein